MVYKNEKEQRSANRSSNVGPSPAAGGTLKRRRPPATPRGSDACDYDYSGMDGVQRVNNN